MDLRPYAARDEAVVVRLWHETKLHAYPYLATEQAYTLGTDTAFFREHVADCSTIWLAVEGGETVGFIALQGSYIDRLYVHPNGQRAGVGTALLDKAKALSPEGLTLHTHQQNISGCAFYERHGFVPGDYGISAPPESAPDVLYRWRP